MKPNMIKEFEIDGKVYCVQETTVDQLEDLASILEADIFTELTKNFTVPNLVKTLRKGNILKRLLPVLLVEKDKEYVPGKPHITKPGIIKAGIAAEAIKSFLFINKDSVLSLGSLANTISEMMPQEPPKSTIGKKQT